MRKFLARLCGRERRLCGKNAGHLIGSRKNGKLCRNFRPDYVEESVDYVEKMPDYAEISKINKVFPFVKVFMTCLTFFSYLLTGISSLNAVFPLDFYAKNGSVFSC